jgi:hypothetical protein
VANGKRRADQATSEYASEGESGRQARVLRMSTVLSPARRKEQSPLASGWAQGMQRSHDN